MIKPHDKVSWIQAGHSRQYGWVHAIVNRGAYQTALIEVGFKHKHTEELPLERLRKESVQ